MDFSVLGPQPATSLTPQVKRHTRRSNIRLHLMDELRSTTMLSALRLHAACLAADYKIKW